MPTSKSSSTQFVNTVPCITAFAEANRIDLILDLCDGTEVKKLPRVSVFPNSKAKLKLGGKAVAITGMDAEAKQLFVRWGREDYTLTQSKSSKKLRFWAALNIESADQPKSVADIMAQFGFDA